MISIALLPGDGVGPEVLDGPSALLRHLAAMGVVEVTGPWPVGASSFAATGDGLPPETLAACEAANAVLFGAAGEHPGVPPTAYRPELALLALRLHFDLRISVRQVWRGDRPPMTVVRNLLGGAYAAGSRVESDGSNAATDVFELDPNRIRELAELAIDYARSSDLPLISVDKANLLATSRLWRGTVSDVAAEHEMSVRHVYVDRMAYEVAAQGPLEAVVLTEGLFGDILSDLACGRAGSIALCGSASVRPGAEIRRDEPCVGLFEPVHGSAPRRAGQGCVNPTGGYLALAALLEWFPETAKWADVVRNALRKALTAGPLTYDLAPRGAEVASTAELAGRINDFAAEWIR
jgi:isocitrate/isopropylmalate dehydrogenase